eukprot:421455_1
MYHLILIIIIVSICKGWNHDSILDDLGIGQTECKRWSCSDDLRDAILATYVWESSQILTRDVISYIVYSTKTQLATEHLDHYNAVVDMRNGIIEYSAHDFPLLAGEKIEFDKIYGAVYNYDEYEYYEKAITESNALKDAELEAINLVKKKKFDDAMDIIMCPEYWDAKKIIEDNAKKAETHLQTRHGCKTFYPDIY